MRTIAKPAIILAAIIVTTLIVETTFLYSVTNAQEVAKPSGDTTTDLFVNIDFIYGFLGALGGLIPIVVGIAFMLKRSVNSSASEFIKRQSEAYEKDKQETRQQIKDYQSSVSTQIDRVNNNVGEKFNSAKENIIEIKKTIEDIDEKLDESRTQNTENRIRLNDIDRRVGLLESNRSSNNALGSMGIK